MSVQKPDLHSILESTKDLSSFPHTLLKVLEASQDPRSSASDLENSVETDPALTARILSAANSAFRPGVQSVTSVRQAIVRLGFKRVQELALGAIVASIFRSRGEVGRYSRQGFWEHCVATGIACRMIADRCPREIGDWAFTAGILHDIGILILDQGVHDDFIQIQEDPAMEFENLHEVEMAHLGFSHQDIGLVLLGNWGLPRPLIVAAGWHHRPSDAPDHPDAASLTHLAHTMVHSIGVGYIEDSGIHPAHMRHSLHTLGLEFEDARILLEDLPAEIEKSRTLFLVGGSR